MTRDVWQLSSLLPAPSDLQPVSIRVIETRYCPNCSKPLGSNEVYCAGYEVDNHRTIPPTYGRGAYCDHISIYKAVGG